MSLHIISAGNGPYKPGTWFECFEDGCRQVEIKNENNRVKVVKEIGLIIPFSSIEPYTTSIGKRGIRRHGHRIAPTR